MDFFTRLLRLRSPAEKTVERWDEPSPEKLQAYLFDGLKATPITDRNTVGLYTTGMSGIPHVPKGKLRDDDYGRAIGYLASEYAFNCIRLVATDLVSIPFKVRNKQTKDDLTDHILLTALRNARLYYQQDVLSLWQIQRYIFGEVYILPEWNAFRIVNCLRLLNPLAVQKYVPLDRLEGFDYQAGRGFHRFGVGEIAFDKVSNPLDDINGLAPMSVALDAINLDKEIKRYTLDTFMKDMRMAGILTARQGAGVPSKEVDAVVEQLKKQRDSRLIGLPWQLEYQQVQQEIDSSQIALSEEARRRIAAALGIPQSVAGAWDSATFQSAPAQIQHYYRSVIFPECRRQDEFINDFVLPYVDDSGLNEAYHDTSEVEAGMEDKKAKTDIYNSRLTSGAITRREYREALGEKATDADDVYYIPSSVVITPVNAVPAVAPAAVPVQPALTPAPVDTTKDVAGMKSAYLMLAAPNHPDLINLQRNVRDYASDIECEWSDPAKFHVTMIAMPAVADEQLDALMHELDGLELPELSLNVGSLNTFDTGTEHAVHFKVRRNDKLFEFQEELYDLCESMGIPLSSFSAPEAYKPHITMGYATQKIKPHTFNSKIMVRPTELQLSSNGNVVYRKSYQAAGSKPATVGKGIVDDALNELDAWEKKYRNGGAQKALSFQNYLIRDTVAEGIRLALIEAAGDKAAVKAVFENARALVAYKAVQATRIDFEDAFQDTLTDAIAGKVTRRRFLTIVNNYINTYGNKAYRDGLKDAGIDDEPDEDEQAQIDSMIADQRTFVTGLADTLYKSDDVISDSMSSQKPAMWWNGSIMPFYSAGLLSGDGNSMYTWNLGRTEKHCVAERGMWGCLTLDGTSKRYKTWDKLNLIAGTAGQDTTCQGFQCDCKLARKAGKSSSVDLFALLASSHPHTHESELAPA